MKVLQDNANTGPQVCRRDVIDVNAIQKDPAIVKIIEPRKQLDERALARPGRPHDRQLLPRRNAETDVTKNHLWHLINRRVVGKRHGPELKLPVNVLRQRHRVFRLFGTLVPVDGLEDPFAGRHRPKQRIELRADGLHRPDQHAEQLREKHDRAE